MSYAAERWARAQTVGNARAKQVLIELAHCHNNRTGQCTPGRQYLHKVTELKLSTISTATAHLESIGLIKKEGGQGVGISYSFPTFKYEKWASEGKAESVPTTRAETVPEVGPNSAHKQERNKKRTSKHPHPHFVSSPSRRRPRQVFLKNINTRSPRGTTLTGLVFQNICSRSSVSTASQRERQSPRRS